MSTFPQRISFDFDGTLDANAAVRELVGLYRRAGKELFILTSRPPEPYWNQGLFTLAAELGFERDHILFAWDTSKSALILQHGIDLHYDNDPHAINEIYHACGPQVGVLVHYQYAANDIYDE